MIDIRKVLFCILVFFAAPAQADHARCEKPIRIVLDTSYSIPWDMNEGTYIDPDKPGLNIELLRLVEKRAGLCFDYVRAPWKRALKMVERHQVEGVVGSSFKRSRLAFGAYPMRGDGPDVGRRMRHATYSLYVRRSSAIEYDGRDIRGLDGAVGVDLGFSIGDDLRERGVRVAEDNGPTVNLEKLIHGRIDAYASLQSSVDFLLAANPERYEGIVKLDTPLRQKAYYLMLGRVFAEKNPDLADRIWRTIAEVRESREFEEVVKEYHREP